MDILDTSTGILFCSTSCAFEREPQTEVGHLVEVPPDEFDRPFYGCYCPNCLTPYEGFLSNPEGGVSDNL